MVSAVSNVVELRAQHTQDMRDELQKLLVRVNSGETLAIAFVEVQRSGVVNVVACDGEFYHQMNSGAARLAWMLASQQCEEEEAPDAG